MDKRKSNSLISDRKLIEHLEKKIAALVESLRTINEDFDHQVSISLDRDKSEAVFFYCRKQYLLGLAHELRNEIYADYELAIQNYQRNKS